MSDIPFKLIAEYEGAPLYLVQELFSGVRRGCTGCCFEAEFKRNSDCRHANGFLCGTEKRIAVRSLDEYKLAAVTNKLTGEMP